MAHDRALSDANRSEPKKDNTYMFLPLYDLSILVAKQNSESGLDLTNYNFKNAVFFGDGTEIDFSGCDLQGADFGGCKLPRASFDDANLKEVIFEGASLQGASFINAECEETTFSRADLSEAIFIFAQLRDVNFSFAVLTGVELALADVRQRINTAYTQGLELGEEEEAA